MRYETEQVEFKIEYVEDIYKEVIAFANTAGGTIYVGINDKGEVVGLECVDDTCNRITNGIRDAILPDVTMFVKYIVEKDRTIRIEVGEGAYKPYYLKAKGLKPSGVYVRQGTSTAPASVDQIRQMIKTADGDIFEELRSLDQELTFLSVSETFKKQEMYFGNDKYFVLGIKSYDLNLYTNMGLILSDQCPYTIKVAVFSDDKNTIFRDRKEFTGSIFHQMEETFSYLKLCNQKRSVIDGLERIDYWDYPIEALREALLNALIHRDYNFSGSIIINVNDKEMEFISIGGLFSGLSPEDIRSGISLSRNRRLSEVFHRLNFVESYGTGIRRIFSLYEGSNRQPTIAITPNSFKIVLPNMNFIKQSTDKKSVESFVLTPQMERLISYLKKYKEISDPELQELLQIKRTRAYLLTRQMADQKIITISGRGVSKRYVLIVNSVQN